MGVDTGRLRVVAAQSAAKPEPATPRPTDRSQAEATSADLDAGQSAEIGLGADGFDSPGPYIKAQRQRLGMSLDELAAQTKIPRPQLELLEADRYEKLPGMVFAKGFLRCCARSLELDPDTVLGLLYDRERAQLQARRREPTDKKLEARITSSGAKSSLRSRHKRVTAPRASAIQSRIAAWLAELPSARILLWIVVALFVALIVFIAFTLASSQAENLIIRS